MPMFWDDFGLSGWISGFVQGGRYTLGRTSTERAWRDGDPDTTLPFDFRLRMNVIPQDEVGQFEWNFGADQPLANEWDFRTILIHELGHAISFYSYGIPESDIKGDEVSTLDRLLVDEDGDKIAAASVGTPGNFNQEGPLFWTGPSANALHGTPVPMGTTGVHVGLTVFDSIMSVPQDEGHSWNGLTIRELSPLTLAMLEDLCWDVVPVPEPSTFGLTILGALSLIGFAYRRKRIVHARQPDLPEGSISTLYHP